MNINGTVKAARTRVLSSLVSLPPQFTDWASILKPDMARWESALAAAKIGPKVLITTSAGIHSHVTTVDSLLAVALTLRGADVHILLCDEALPACWVAFTEKIPPDQFVKFGPQKLCGKCFLSGSTVYRPLGLPIHRYSEFLSSKDFRTAAELSSTVPLAEIENFCFEGIKVGEQALAGALRYYTRGDLRDEPEGEGVLRRYLRASLLSTFAIRGLFSKFAFRSACCTHGMYVPEGLVGEVARSQGVRMVSWADSYLKQTFLFSQYDTHHRTLLSEQAWNLENAPWTEKMESEILEYLKSRWYGTHDWIRYTQDWSEDVLSIGAEMGIDFNKPCIGLLTNVIWDAQVHYGGNAFANMLEWTLETIKYFASRPDLQLIVRVHPAELRGRRESRQRMVDEIKRVIPNLPKNVFVIPPDSRMNTYAAMLKCNAVIIYGTKTGAELACFGVPVIVAGEAWIRNKGVTLDASSPQEYLEILDRLPLQERMRDESVRRARQYAYHFFFRRQIPVSVLQQGKDSLTKLEISGIDELLPGRHTGLDIICNGIIRGDEFVYPAELYSDKLVTNGKFTTSSVERSVKTSNKPLVSVIIPTANADGLADTLDSVYAQDGVGSEFDLEVIIIDSGSTDRSSQFASRDSGPRYIRLEKTSLLSVARNAGLKESTGQYVAFLDDGNVWLPERLGSHIAILEHYPEFGAAYGQFISTGNGEATLYPDAGAAPAGSVFRAFLTEQFAFPSFATVRREAFVRAGYFDETLRGMEDYEMFLRLAFFGQFAFVAGALGQGRFSLNSIWLGRIQRGDYQTELPYILNKAFALLADESDTSTLKRDVAGRWFTKIAHYLDGPETVELLRSHVLYSIKENPWMMTHPSSRASVLGYAAKVLASTYQDGSSIITPAIRNFCRDIKGIQNGNSEKDGSQTRRFLGDALTQTAGQMWDRRDFRAAGFTATYAVRQDFAQIIRQIRRASTYFLRVLLPT